MKQALRDSMNLRGLAVLIGVALFVAVASAGAQEVIPLTLRGTGAFIAQGAPIDTDGDGRNAALTLHEGNHPQFGKVTYQAVAEFANTPAVAVCPNGNPGGRLQLIAGAIVIRVENGNLIHTQVDGGSVCFDQAMNVAFVKQDSTITGGTGQFAGATGNFTTRSRVTVLVGDPILGQGFGSLVTAATGTITIP